MALPPSVKIAFRCVPPMIAAAKERRTMTYGDLSKLVDHPAYYLGKPLGYVRDNICIRHHLPMLTVVVVDRDTGLPGESFLPDGRGDLSDDQYREIVAEHTQRVFEYDRWEQTWENLKRHYGFDE